MEGASPRVYRTDRECDLLIALQNISCLPTHGKRQVIIVSVK